MTPTRGALATKRERQPSLAIKPHQTSESNWINRTRKLLPSKNRNASGENHAARYKFVRKEYVYPCLYIILDLVTGDRALGIIRSLRDGMGCMHVCCGREHGPWAMDRWCVALGQQIVLTMAAAHVITGTGLYEYAIAIPPGKLTWRVVRGLSLYRETASQEAFKHW